jgi:UDP-N-acetylglucosamine:LPS N-acetylglucosamine transferase
VLGFIDYVYELLSISEVVITKCGASTFSEVLLCGKIPLVNSYIWEQERGNVDFIKENGMGVYEPNPKRIANLAREIIGSNEYNGWFKQNIQRMGLSNGTPLVSDFILQFN